MTYTCELNKWTSKIFYSIHSILTYTYIHAINKYHFYLAINFICLSHIWVWLHIRSSLAIYYHTYIYMRFLRIVFRLFWSICNVRKISSPWAQCRNNWFEKYKKELNELCLFVYNIAQSLYNLPAMKPETKKCMLVRFYQFIAIWFLRNVTEIVIRLSITSDYSVCLWNDTNRYVWNKGR